MPKRVHGKISLSLQRKQSEKTPATPLVHPFPKRVITAAALDSLLFLSPFDYSISRGAKAAVYTVRVSNRPSWWKKKKKEVYTRGNIRGRRNTSLLQLLHRLRPSYMYSRSSCRVQERERVSVQMRIYTVIAYTHTQTERLWGARQSITFFSKHCHYCGCDEYPWWRRTTMRGKRE